jgi:predicted nucleotidyltransferase component of viral defense system
LDRFSTDLDLDILDISKEQEIIEKVKEILLRLGDVKNETLGKAIHRWIFRYDADSMNIKVELNKRVRENNSYELQNID